MSYTEEDRLKDRIWDLRREIRDLEEENNRLRSKLDEAEYRIDKELTPRIKAEERNYDRWALDPERT